MTLICRWILIALLAGGVANAMGEEAEPGTDTESTPAVDDADRPSASTVKPTAKSKPNTEVFVPSEEISEDFAVSFPVDI